MEESDIPSSQSVSGDTPRSPVPPGLGLQIRIKHVLGVGVELECKYSPKWQWQQSLGLPTAISALWDKAKSRHPGNLGVPICRVGTVLCGGRCHPTVTLRAWQLLHSQPTAEACRTSRQSSWWERGGAMDPGQESPPPPIPQGNQTCPTQRQYWRLDRTGAQKVTLTPLRLRVQYRASF